MQILLAYDSFETTPKDGKGINCGDLQHRQCRYLGETPGGRIFGALISPTFSSKAKTTPLGQNGPGSRSLPTYAGLPGALLKHEYSLRDSQLPTGGFPLFIISYSLYPRLSPPLTAVRRASCLSGRSNFASWPLFRLDLGYQLQQNFYSIQLRIYMA